MRLPRGLQSNSFGDPAWAVEEPRNPVLLRRRRGERRPTPPGLTVSERDLGALFEAFDLTRQGVFLHTDLLFERGDAVRLEIARDGGPSVVVAADVVDVVTEREPGGRDLGPGQGAGVMVAFRELSISELETLVSIAGPTVA